MPEKGQDPFGISVIIVNWNSRDDLAACLSALAAQTDLDFETIVLDNGSTDGSVAMVAERFGHVKVIELTENVGFAEGCNRGIEGSSRAWIATLNNDADAEPEWIAELRAAARAGGPRLGMLQSRIVLKQKRNRANSTGLVLFADGCVEDRSFDQPLRDDDVVEEIFCPSAGAALYRREMLDALRLDSGFFDRSYFMYVEDVDLGWRARLADWTSFYVPSAVVHHSFQGSSRRHGRHFVALQCKKNRLRTLLKNGSLRFLATTMPRTLLDVAEACIWMGPRALPQFVSAAIDAVKQRAVVTRLATIDRRAVELRWVGKT